MTDQQLPTVWQVYIRLDNGEGVEALVLSPRAADACVVLGDWVRQQKGVPVDGAAGIETAEARPVSGQAILSFNRNSISSS